jgi:hypothetical protein
MIAHEAHRSQKSSVTWMVSARIAPALGHLLVLNTRLLEVAKRAHEDPLA